MSLGTLGPLTVVAGGTPQRFTSTTLNVRGFFIQGFNNNAGFIFIGNAALVKATLVGVYRLIAPSGSAGTRQPTVWDVVGDIAGPYDLSTLWFDGTTADGILVTYVT